MEATSPTTIVEDVAVDAGNSAERQACDDATRKDDTSVAANRCYSRLTSVECGALLEEKKAECRELQHSMQRQTRLCDPAGVDETVKMVSQVTAKAMGKFIEGSASNLRSLTDEIWLHVCAEQQELQQAVENLIISQASRKSYSCDKERAKKASVMEDESADLLWRWELKSVATLGALKEAAQAQRSWRKQATAYVAALQQAVKALAHGVGSDKNRARIVTAMGKLDALPRPGDPAHAAAPPRGGAKAGKPRSAQDASLSQTGGASTADATQPSQRLASASAPRTPAASSRAPPDSSTAGAAAALVTPAPGSVAAAADQTATAPSAAGTGAKRPRLDATEKAALAEAKRVEKEKAAREREEERALKKAAEAAEKERKRKEKEEASRRKKASHCGFQKPEDLERSRGLMASWFKPVTPAPKTTEVPTESTTSQEEQIKGTYEKVAHIRKALRAAKDVDVDVLADWARTLEAWRVRGRELASSRLPGLPPSFSRREDCPRDSAKLAAAAGATQWRGARTWRRKLLHFRSDSARPAFYGSFSRKTRCFGPRAILRKDPDLDYDVMSDEDWQSEPEGEDLCGNDADVDDDDVLPEEEDDGFFVADGYLSSDEKTFEQDEEGAAGGKKEEVVDAHPAGGAPGWELDQPTTSFLNALLAAKKASLPLVVCREPGTAPPDDGSVKLRGRDLLQPFRMIRLLPDVIVPATVELAVPPDEAPTDKSARDVFYEAHVKPELSKFVDRLDDETAKKKGSIVAAFLAHSTDGRVNKTRVEELLPIVAKKCTAVGRWVSQGWAAELSPQFVKVRSARLTEASAAINSAALARLAAGLSAAPKKSPAGVKRPSPAGMPSRPAPLGGVPRMESAGPEQSAPARATTGLLTSDVPATDRHAAARAANEHGTKRKADTDAAAGAPAKAAKVSPAVGAAADVVDLCDTDMAGDGDEGRSAEPVEPPTADAASGAPAAAVVARTGGGQDGAPAGELRPNAEPPQPCTGQGEEMAAYMDNPERLRLPGGGGDTASQRPGSPGNGAALLEFERALQKGAMPSLACGAALRTPEKVDPRAPASAAAAKSHALWPGKRVFAATSAPLGRGDAASPALRDVSNTPPRGRSPGTVPLRLKSGRPLSPNASPGCGNPTGRRRRCDGLADVRPTRLLFDADGGADFGRLRDGHEALPPLPELPGADCDLPAELVDEDRIARLALGLDGRPGQPPLCARQAESQRCATPAVRRALGFAPAAGWVDLTPKDAASEEAQLQEALELSMKCHGSQPPRELPLSEQPVDEQERHGGALAAQLFAEGQGPVSDSTRTPAASGGRRRALRIVEVDESDSGSLLAPSLAATPACIVDCASPQLCLSLTPPARSDRCPADPPHSEALFSCDAAQDSPLAAPTLAPPATPRASPHNVRQLQAYFADDLQICEDEQSPRVVPRVYALPPTHPASQPQSLDDITLRLSKYAAADPAAFTPGHCYWRLLCNLVTHAAGERHLPDGSLKHFTSLLEAPAEEMARFVAHVPAMLPSALLKAVANSVSPLSLRSTAAVALRGLAECYFSGVKRGELDPERQPRPGQPALLTEHQFLCRYWAQSLSQPLQEVRAPRRGTSSAAVAGVAAKCAKALEAPLLALTAPDVPDAAASVASACAYARALAGADGCDGAGSAPVLAIVKLLPDGRARQARINFGAGPHRAAEAQVYLPQDCVALVATVVRVLSTHDCEALCRPPFTRELRAALVAGLLQVASQRARPARTDDTRDALKCLHTLITADGDSHGQALRLDALEQVVAALCQPGPSPPGAARLEGRLRVLLERGKIHLYKPGALSARLWAVRLFQRFVQSGERALEAAAARALTAIKEHAEDSVLQAWESDVASFVPKDEREAHALNRLVANVAALREACVWRLGQHEDGPAAGALGMPGAGPRSRPQDIVSHMQRPRHSADRPPASRSRDRALAPMFRTAQTKAPFRGPHSAPSALPAAEPLLDQGGRGAGSGAPEVAAAVDLPEFPTWGAPQVVCQVMRRAKRPSQGQQMAHQALAKERRS